MNNNSTFVLKLVLSVLGTILIVHLIGIWSCKPKEDPNYELLDLKIDSLKNYRIELKSVVDTTKVKIIEVEKRYETIRDHIITQSVDSDCITFSNYLSNYQRLSSNNNSTTVEGD